MLSPFPFHVRTVSALPCPSCNTHYPLQSIVKNAGNCSPTLHPLLSTPCPLSSCVSFYHYLFSTISTYIEQLSLHFCAIWPAVMHPVWQLYAKQLHWLDPQAHCGVRVWTTAGSGHEFTEVQCCLCLTGKALVLWTTHEGEASLRKLLHGASLASGKVVDGAEKLSFHHRLFLNCFVPLL